jgi:hypothetical protein
VIEKAPEEVSYGKEFSLEVGAGDVARISWIRLPSVTHAFDQNQRINFLSFKAKGGTLKVKAPDKPGSCPPGHYMLFVLNQLGVPSHARSCTSAAMPRLASAPAAQLNYRTSEKRQDDLKKAKAGTRLQWDWPRHAHMASACWGGARGAEKLSAWSPQPIPNAESSTAQVHIEGTAGSRRLAETVRGDRQRQLRISGIRLAIDGTVRSSGKLELTTARPRYQDRAAGIGKSVAMGQNERQTKTCLEARDAGLRSSTAHD